MITLKGSCLGVLLATKEFHSKEVKKQPNINKVKLADHNGIPGTASGDILNLENLFPHSFFIVNYNRPPENNMTCIYEQFSKLL